MKFNQFLTYSAFVIAALTISGLTAMERHTDNALIKELEILPFDEKRDMEDITTIMKDEWEKLYVGKPFDLKIVNALMAPTSTEGEFAKMLMVARHNQKVIGYVTYYMFKNRDPKEGHLESGALRTDYRGKGIAKEFFPKILQELKEMGAEILTIFVKKDNIAAKSLYEKFGFGNPEDAIRGTCFKLTQKIK